MKKETSSNKNYLLKVLNNKEVVKMGFDNFGKTIANPPSVFPPPTFTTLSSVFPKIIKGPFETSYYFNTLVNNILLL